MFVNRCCPVAAFREESEPAAATRYRSVACRFCRYSVRKSIRKLSPHVRPSVGEVAPWAEERRTPDHPGQVCTLRPMASTATPPECRRRARSWRRPVPVGLLRSLSEDESKPLNCHSAVRDLAPVTALLDDDAGRDVRDADDDVRCVLRWAERASPIEVTRINWNPA
jgi:hypothetical protein